jgi:hypothetical protein
LTTIYYIVWWCKKGAKIEGSLAWLKRNIDRNLQNLGDIALYVWLGTCNLTSKDGPAGTFTTVFWRYLLNFVSDIDSGYLIYVATWFGGRVVH